MKECGWVSDDIEAPVETAVKVFCELEAIAALLSCKTSNFDWIKHKSREWFIDKANISI